MKKKKNVLKLAMTMTIMVSMTQSNANIKHSISIPAKFTALSIVNGIPVCTLAGLLLGNFIEPYCLAATLGTFLGTLNGTLGTLEHNEHSRLPSSSRTCRWILNWPLIGGSLGALIARNTKYWPHAFGGGALVGTLAAFTAKKYFSHKISLQPDIDADMLVHPVINGTTGFITGYAIGKTKKAALWGLCCCVGLDLVRSTIECTRAFILNKEDDHEESIQEERRQNERRDEEHRREANEAQRIRAPQVIVPIAQIPDQESIFDSSSDHESRSDTESVRDEYDHHFVERSSFDPELTRE